MAKSTAQKSTCGRSVCSHTSSCKVSLLSMNLLKTIRWRKSQKANSTSSTRFLVRHRISSQLSSPQTPIKLFRWDRRRDIRGCLTMHKPSESPIKVKFLSTHHSSPITETDLSNIKQLYLKVTPSINQSINERTIDRSNQLSHLPLLFILLY